MDDVPGFGRSPQAALRDDTIAYYEAWQRDSVVATCMANHGFEWRVEALYPRKGLRAIAEYLSVVPGKGRDKIAPANWNRNHESSMAAERRNGYLLALYGESAEDIDLWRESEGGVPDGRDPNTFAKRGCSEKGWQKIPGVWALRDELSDELPNPREYADWSAFRERHRTEITAHQRHYREVLTSLGRDEEFLRHVSRRIGARRQ